MSLNSSEQIEAITLATSTMLTALLGALDRKGILTKAEIREVSEEALLILEEAQGASNGAQDVFSAAREIIEQHLRRQRQRQPSPKTDNKA